MIFTRKKIKLVKKQLLILPALLLLIGFFFVTRGQDPHTSELAFIEHSRTHLGSVVPASCNSAPPTSHFLNDCTATCPATGLPYDPYLDAAACPSAPPTAAINVTPLNVSYAGTVEIDWSSTGSTGCTAGGNWSGAIGISGISSRTNLTSDKTYTLYCSNGGTNSATVSATVSVCPAGAPSWNGTACSGVTGSSTASLVALPQNVSYNGTTTLTWNSTNSTGCTASGGWSGAKNNSGSVSIGGQTSSQTFSIFCSNGLGDSSTVTVPITVCPQATPYWNGSSCVVSTTAVTLELAALPTNINYGGSASIRWRPARATSCTASGAWSGSLSTVGGSTSTGPITTQKTYNASCSNAGGSTPLRSVTLDVCPIGTPTWNGSTCTTESGTLTGNTCTIATGSGSCSMDVAWSTLNASGQINVRRTYAGYSTMASGPSGVPTFTFPHSTTPYLVDLYSVNTGVVLATANFTASCALGGFDNLGNVCANPFGFSYITGNYYGPGLLNFSCFNSNAYNIRRDGTLVGSATPGTYTSASLITFPVAITGNYQVQCLHGDYGVLLTPVLFNSPPPPAPVISILASPRTITKNTSSTLSWSIQYPTNSCTLTAKAVCANNVCTTEQLAAKTAINNKLASENTDTTDPNGSRNIETAINTVAPSHVNTDYKALGKKTLKISNSMDFTITCGLTKSSTRVRVTQSNEQ
jgi:hypothetical protein